MCVSSDRQRSQQSSTAPSRPFQAEQAAPEKTQGSYLNSVGFLKKDTSFRNQVTTYNLSILTHFCQGFQCKLRVFQGVLKAQGRVTNQITLEHREIGNPPNHQKRWFTRFSTTFPALRILTPKTIETPKPQNRWKQVAI